MAIFIKKETLEAVTLSLVAAATIVVIFVAMYFTLPKKEKVYDCSIAEISPDYPTDVKEGCRKLRAENVQNLLQKPK
jgi:hypothetical protein